MSDLAKQWQGLSTNQKDYIALTQAGSNQSQNFLALMSNFQTALDATATAYDSAGSAAQENARYMESLEAKTQNLKATFQDLSNNVIENELVKSLLDLANKGLTVLNTEVGSTITQFTLLTAGMIGFVGVAKFIAGPIFNSLLGGFSGAGGLVILLGAATVAGYKFFQMWKDNHPTIKEATKNIEDNNSALERNKKRLEEIEKIPWPDRTSEIINEKNALEQENAELEEQNKWLKENRKEQLTGSTFVTKAKGYKVKGNSYIIDVETEAEAWARLEATEKKTRKELEALGYELERAYQKVEVTAEEINNELSVSGQKYINILNEQNELTDEQIHDFELTRNELHQRAEAIISLGVPYEELSADQQRVIDTDKQLNEVFEETAGVSSIMSAGLASNREQAKKLAEQYPELQNGIEKCTIATLELIAKEQIWNNQELEVDNKIEALARLVVAYSGAAVAAEQLAWYINAAQNGDYDAIRQLSSQYGTTNYKDIFKKMLGVDKTESPKKTGNSSITVGSGGGVTKGSKSSPTDEALKSFQSHYKNLQHMRAMDEIDAERYYGDLRWLIDDYIRTATAHMKKYGLTTEQINQNMYQYEEEIYKWRNGLVEEHSKAQEEALKKQKEAWEKYHKEQIEQLESQKDAYEAAFSYIADKIQEEIEALEDEKEATAKYWDDKIAKLQKTNEELDKQIELEKLEGKLAKARQKKMLVFKDGRYQYVNDIQEVSKAQAELDKYHRDEALRKEVENLETLKKEALDSIDAQIKNWEKYKESWSSVVDDYQKHEDKLLAEQVLGIKLEGDNWKKRLDNLSSYVDEYEQIMKRFDQVSKEDFGGSGGGGNQPGGGGGSTPVEPDSEATPSKLLPVYDTDRTAIDMFKREANVAKARGDEAGAKAAHQKAENVRAQYGYSGGRLGNEFIPLPQYEAYFATHGHAGAYASGTLGALGGMSLVGEQGPELRVLGSGDGIIPADITRNLWQWGQTSPGMMMASLSGGSFGSNTMSVVIQSLNLPEVKDGNDFVQYLQNNLWTKTIQFASK